MFNKLRKKQIKTDDKLEQIIQELNSKFEFLYYWFLRSDENIRDIFCKIGVPEHSINHNDMVFDHKWKFLGKGISSLENSEHKKNITDTVVKWTGLPAEWFKSKTVLDAGCGDGRLSYGMCKLGASVTSFDKVASVVERTKEYCKEFPDHKAFVWDILIPYKTKERFDLVLSFGVLHCTGNTQKGIDNLGKLVKKDGYFSLTVYGYPGFDRPQEFVYLCKKEKIRQAIKHLSSKDAQEYVLGQVGDLMLVRGWFDATAPRIEDHYTFSQITLVLKRAAFAEITRLEPQIRNICVHGKKT